MSIYSKQHYNRLRGLFCQELHIESRIEKKKRGIPSETVDSELRMAAFEDPGTGKYGRKPGK